MMADLIVKMHDAEVVVEVDGLRVHRITYTNVGDEDVRLNLYNMRQDAYFNYVLPAGTSESTKIDGFYGAKYDEMFVRLFEV